MTTIHNEVTWELRTKHSELMNGHCGDYQLLISVVMMMNRFRHAITALNYEPPVRSNDEMKLNFREKM